MNTEQIIIYIIFGVLAAILIGALIVKIIKFVKMSKEEKIKLIKTYLKGIIALAEQEIVGTKRGAERLQMVEGYFNEKAPYIYKAILLILGKDNLRELIEEALKEVKNSFQNQ